jgi:hypothetical protein
MWLYGLLAQIVFRQQIRGFENSRPFFVSTIVIEVADSGQQNCGGGQTLLSVNYKQLAVRSVNCDNRSESPRIYAGEGARQRSGKRVRL